MDKLPKIEIHCHLDGSVRPTTILDIVKRENIDINSNNLEEIIKLLKVTDSCTSLNEYLEKFEIPNKVMQTEENLERIAFELLEDAASENIKYIEVRFAPQLHTKSGLSFDKIIKSVIKGIKRAEDIYEIKGNIILSCMRNMDVENGLEVIKAGEKFLHKGVVGVDLAGPEEEGFSYKFKPIIDKAKEYGYRVTIHAGEGASGKNVIESINILGAERIGHGVKINDMKEAYELVKEKNIILEMCPTSNIQTKAVDKIENYPFYKFYEDNIKVTLNTDNRTVSNINLTKEINLIFERGNLSEQEYKKLYLNTIEATFAKDEVKEWLKSFI